MSKDAAEFLVQDPRHPAEMLTRSELARTCIHNGLPVAPGSSKKTMVLLVKDAGIDVTRGFPGAPFRFENEHVHIQGEGSFSKLVVRRGMLKSEMPEARAARDQVLEKRLEAAAAITPDDIRAQMAELQAKLDQMQQPSAPKKALPNPPPLPEIKDGDYSGLRMPTLRRLCKARGIKFLPTDKKSDLLEKLSGEDTAEWRQ